MNFYNSHLSKFTLLILIIFPINGKSELHENVNFYQSVLGSVNISSQSNKCGSPTTTDQKNCSYLFNLFERDRSTGMFFGMIGDSPWDTCKKYISNSKDISINEFEKKLSENNLTSLGLRSNYFSSKMDECIPRKYSRSSSDVDAQSKIIVSLGYDYLNRIKKSTGQLSDEIKTLNSIIGDPIASGIPCGSFIMPSDKKLCQDISDQHCTPHNELAQYTDNLYETAIEPLIALKGSYKNLVESYSKNPSLVKPGSQKLLKDIRNNIKSLENQFPILKGKKLGPFLDSETRGGLIPNKSKLQAVIKAQLIENRSNLTKKLEENADMNNCLVYGDEGYCKKFNENFERMPPRTDVAFFEKGGSVSPTNRAKNYAASELYSTNQCLDNFRGLKNEFNSFAADFSINVGLTIFSGGASLLLRAGGQGVKLALASHKAMLLADAAFLGVGVDEAISTCSKELNKLETMSPSIKDEKSNQMNVCPTSLNRPEYVVVANYQSCVTGAMLASLNALPFVPGAVSKFLARSKVTKNANEVVSEVSSLMKFKTPKKAFDPHDLKSAGTILPKGKVQDPSTLFKRDGVYVYIIDDKGNMVLSHRTPNLSAGTKEGDQFLGTHRGLFNKLSAESADVAVVAAGEIRVVGGVPTRVSPRAGSFHSTPEEVLASMKSSASAEEKATIDNLLKEYNKLSPADRSNSMMVEMHMEDFLDANPTAKSVFEKMQKQLIDLTDKRLDIAKDAMASRGMLPKEVDTKFVREVSGDAHIEGKAAAIAEIECSKTKTCIEQMNMYQKVAKKFLEKYRTAEQSELAVVAKLQSRSIEGLSTKEKAFQFFNQRSYLLFKEGPIEFIQNGHPEKFGISEKEALRYLEEWSKQF